jgi:rhodanese-related sulfurtransferase
MTKLEEIEKKFTQLKFDNFSNIPDISIKEFQEINKLQKVILVDVREKEEQQVSMIPGAIPSSNFDPKQLKDEILIAYCTIGYRSGLYLQKLLQKNPHIKQDQIFNLKGSILSWTHESNEKLIDSNGKETNKVHVFGQSWDFSHESYESVYFDIFWQGIVGLKSLIN